MAHNAMFDVAILAWHYGVYPAFIMDTLSMARALRGNEGNGLAKLAEEFGLPPKGHAVHSTDGLDELTPEIEEELAAYCAHDVFLLEQVFDRLNAMAGPTGYPTKELRLIDMVIRMYINPQLELDGEMLKQAIVEEETKRTDLLGKLNVAEKDLASNDKFAELLTLLGVDPPIKISKTTGKEAYAFAKNDAHFQALLNHDDENVALLCEARLAVKSTQARTRAQRFFDVSERGTLPVPLHYYAAHTGRWGGDDRVNMQNLPRKSPLKDAMLAPKGYRLIDSDSSQIEARTLAWLAGQKDLVEAFEKGEDVYKIMAAKIYDKPEADITKDERFVGKTTILGCGYGMGAAKFKKQLKVFNVDVTEGEAQGIIDTYRKSYPAIPKLWRKAGGVLETIIGNLTEKFGRDDLLVAEGKKGILLPNGLYLRYPNLRTAKDADGMPEYVYETKKGKATAPNRIYGGKVVENVCQALARIIIGEQMLLIAKKYKVVMTVHDAIGCVVPEGDVGVALENIQMCMLVRPNWALELPLNCEAGAGKSYGEC
jgi:DNA polymerase